MWPWNIFRRLVSTNIPGRYKDVVDDFLRSSSLHECGLVVHSGGKREIRCELVMRSVEMTQLVSAEPRADEEMIVVGVEKTFENAKGFGSGR